MIFAMMLIAADPAAKTMIPLAIRTPVIECVKREAVALAKGSNESAEVLARVGVAKCDWSAVIEKGKSLHRVAYTLGTPEHHVDTLKEIAITEAIVAVIEARKS